MKILVTGACGYIGAHTLVDLIDNGFEVISVDDNSRSSTEILEGVALITQKKIKHYAVNLCDLEKMQTIFVDNPDIKGVIHFAAYKSVPESVKEPLLYYNNNLGSLLNILSCIEKYDVPYFVFSSSCSVYGNADVLPVTEATPLKVAESPYANTKQMGEQIITHFAKVHPANKHILLRYFNPVGAHLSAEIGEVQEKPENLVPIITQTAIGRRAAMTVYGSDYNTRDGSSIRDYIHVVDIANAHTKALQYLIEERNTHNCEVFNLGSGNGVTVLEAIKAFEKVSGKALNYTLSERRPGDVEQIYANNEKARKILQWQPKYGIDDMMGSAWQWELKMAQKKHNRLPQ